MSSDLNGKCNHPEYITNLEEHFRGNPVTITLPHNNIPRDRELINNENNYLFGRVEYKSIVQFKCGGCSKEIQPTYNPGRIPKFSCENCKIVF